MNLFIDVVLAVIFAGLVRYTFLLRSRIQGMEVDQILSQERHQNIERELAGYKKQRALMEEQEPEKAPAISLCTRTGKVHMRNNMLVALSFRDPNSPPIVWCRDCKKEMMLEDQPKVLAGIVKTIDERQRNDSRPVTFGDLARIRRANGDSLNLYFCEEKKSDDDGYLF